MTLVNLVNMGELGYKVERFDIGIFEEFEEHPVVVNYNFRGSGAHVSLTVKERGDHRTFYLSYRVSDAKTEELISIGIKKLTSLEEVKIKFKTDKKRLKRALTIEQTRATENHQKETLDFFFTYLNKDKGCE